MLETQGKENKYNNLSPQLRLEIETAAKKFGRYVKYRFAIAKKNPDGDRRTGGEYIYPLLYTLTPVTFDIQDPYDKGKKRIGLVNQLKEFGAQDDGFKRVEIKEGWMGTYTLDLTKMEDQDVFAYLYLHPKLESGKFRDENMPAMVAIIDEVQRANEALLKKSKRVDALIAATSMMPQEIKDFASAMGWDENQDLGILQNDISDMAEKDPEFFSEFINHKNIEQRAILKRAMDNNLIAFVPVENKFIWVKNGQTIATLDRVEDGRILERMSDWIYTSKNGQETYAKIKSLLQADKKAVV